MKHLRKANQIEMCFNPSYNTTVRCAVNYSLVHIALKHDIYIITMMVRSCNQYEINLLKILLRRKSGGVEWDQLNFYAFFNHHNGFLLPFGWLSSRLFRIIVCIIVQFGFVRWGNSFKNYSQIKWSSISVIFQFIGWFVQ